MKCHIVDHSWNNIKGMCCCNCQFQIPITGHPWNTNEFVKGSCSEIIGYGCMLPEMKRITFMEAEHSLCECHEFKKEIK